ncbi:Glucose-6-phosphate isomerase [Methylocella tundrae]|uniref:Glucose-6-phosphate isomerase n=1 Tax=Methylocella tundrae TaxID=227605 RepID=A0A8B6M8A8_METTU|nr:glucose-6-phosphate isomerase [Methylocella tundrae]VTZ51120.1 Glucose-6-phosphate isomerase [Methylocella tundrae]
MASSEVAQAFAALEAHKRQISGSRIPDLFAADPQRFARFSIAFDDLLFDFSKHRVTDETRGLLLDLARAAKVEARRAALFNGDPVNGTEHRAALHMALRNLGGAPMRAAGVDVMPQVIAERRKMEAFAERVRNGEIRAANGERFTDIVNFGIGGSDLGPAMAARALSPFIADHLSLHFVANVDGADFADTMRRVPVETTLFIICSKTFTTLETMTNAATARKYVAEKLGEAAIGYHFCAVSTQLEKIAAFGIASDRVFGFWDWVGGRYSVWSAIALSLAIGIGRDNFEDFLRGGEDIDRHFMEAPLDRNIPVLMALLGVWYRNVFGFATHAVIPYDQRMARFSAYLQQLDMESNGKSVDLSGAAVTRATAPVIWGEPGTNGQHAFFQLLHQGTEIVPIDFLVAAEPIAADAKHHEILFANCLAQSQALMQGRSLAEVVSLLESQKLSPDAIKALAPHKVFQGDRPSSTFLYRQLTPRTLGRLIALYEHKVFVQGVIWDINSFDQWGVELGKELALKLGPIVSDSGLSTEGLDSSTAGLVEARRRAAM